MYCSMFGGGCYKCGCQYVLDQGLCSGCFQIHGNHSIVEAPCGIILALQEALQVLNSLKASYKARSKAKATKMTHNVTKQYKGPYRASTVVRTGFQSLLTRRRYLRHPQPHGKPYTSHRTG